MALISNRNFDIYPLHPLTESYILPEHSLISGYGTCYRDFDIFLHALKPSARFHLYSSISRKGRYVRNFDSSPSQAIWLSPTIFSSIHQSVGMAHVTKSLILPLQTLWPSPGFLSNFHISVGKATVMKLWHPPQRPVWQSQRFHQKLGYRLVWQQKQELWLLPSYCRLRTPNVNPYYPPICWYSPCDRYFERASPCPLTETKVPLKNCVLLSAIL